MENKQIDIMRSVKRITTLSMNRRQLAEEITLAKEKERDLLQPAYIELDNAIRTCILTEAEFLSKLE